MTKEEWLSIKVIERTCKCGRRLRDWDWGEPIKSCKKCQKREWWNLFFRGFKSNYPGVIEWFSNAFYNLSFLFIPIGYKKYIREYLCNIGYKLHYLGK